MNKSNFSIGLILSLIACVVSITIAVFLWLEKPKIAYVRSFELVEKYNGTIEGRARFQEQKNAVAANVDSLQRNFEFERDNYLKNAPGMTAGQRVQMEEELTRRHEQLSQYSSAVQQKIKEDDAKMTQEVLSQINSFVESFGKKNGYTLILGTTASGSILYGEEKFDITEYLLKELNNNYQGK